MTRPTVALVGVSGYGRRHLIDLLRLHAEGRIELVGLADPRIPAEVHEELERSSASPRTAATLDELFALCAPQTVVVATPPHTHHRLALTALDAGASVFVEKPPVPLPEQLDELKFRARRRRVEFGFQQTRSVVMAADAARHTYPIGELRRITAYGALQRSDSYYTRAPWAGRRMLGDAAVFDGSLFNPLAHAVHAALVLARREESSWVMNELEVELGAVRDIEADDTAAMRIRSVRGPLVTALGTTAADEVIEPSLLLQGTSGAMEVRLRDLRIDVEVDGVASALVGTPAPAALGQAVTRPDDAADPLTDIEAVRSFVRLVAAAVDTAPVPKHLSGVVVDRDPGPGAEYPGISAAIARAAADGTLLGEAGVPIGAAHHRASLENWDGRLTGRHQAHVRPYSEVAE